MIKKTHLEVTYKELNNASIRCIFGLYETNYIKLISNGKLRNERLIWPDYWTMEEFLSDVTSIDVTAMIQTHG